MPWKLDAALALLLAAPSTGLGRLSETGRSIVVLVSAAVTLIIVAFGAGVGWTMTKSEYGSHPDRLAAVEEWQATHDSTVTQPGLARIGVLEDRHESWEERWDQDIGMMREMVYQLYCERFASRCEAQPRED